MLEQAVNEYNLADSLANQGKWQDAVLHLQTASNLLVQASSKEEEYQYKKQQQELANWRQKASDSINTADQKISQLKDCVGSEAKTLLQQAQTQLANAQNSFNQATLQSYNDAYSSALQASSYADQASAKEQTYQEQKRQQQQLILIGGDLSDCDCSHCSNGDEKKEETGNPYSNLIFFCGRQVFSTRFYWFSENRHPTIR